MAFGFRMKHKQHKTEIRSDKKNYTLTDHFEIGLQKEAGKFVKNIISWSMCKLREILVDFTFWCLV